jgi:hypothetical protein
LTGFLVILCQEMAENARFSLKWAVAVVFARLITIILEPGQGSIGFLQQVFAAFAPQRKLANEPIGCYVLGIPGSRSFSYDRVAFDGRVIGHFDFSF